MRAAKRWVSVYQIGDFDQIELANALSLANQVQDSFRFALEPRQVPIGRKAQLPNGGYDLNTVSKIHFDALDPKDLVLYFAHVPYGITQQGNKKDWFYFTSAGDIAEQGYFVASSHLWATLWPSRRLESYVLGNLAQAILQSRYAMRVHEDTRCCLGDYCYNERHFVRRFLQSGLCQAECEGTAQEALRDGRISLAEMVAALRLFNRASRRKRCFVAMPFREQLWPVYTTVRDTLSANGWHVVRGDELRRPPVVVEAIVQSLLVSDLVIGDLTSKNPNVFHEVGVAQATGRDVLLLSQHSDLPFNVRANRYIRYQNTKPGLLKLRAALMHLVGNGRYGPLHTPRARSAS